MKELKSADWNCEACGDEHPDGENIEVHHLTYTGPRGENWWLPPEGALWRGRNPLIVLCSWCHHEYHQDLRLTMDNPIFVELLRRKQVLDANLVLDTNLEITTHLIEAMDLVQ